MAANKSNGIEGVHFRSATEKDIPGLLWLIQLLAEYEKEPNALKIGKDELLRDGFGEDHYFRVILAELDTGSLPVAYSPDQNLPSASMERDEHLVGYALYFFNYSTWQGRVLYLEDLFIRQEYRNRGYGTALMRECAKVAMEKNCARMVWQVLDWNTKALDLYERLGGACEREWLTVRMYKPDIKKFASLS